MTAIVAATRDYETWLGAAIPIVEVDLKAKHTELASTPLRFLRGTYYYWLARMPALLPDAVSAPPVPLIGDLHAENFGTWRDKHGVRRWGVNDLDEIGRGPYAIDLIRLATSCALSPHVALKHAEVCDILLDTWLHADPGHAVRIDDAEHLHHLLPAPHPDAKYYAALTEPEQVDAATIPEAVRAAAQASVDGSWQPTWHRRVAGTGSLGHPRLVGVWQTVAREVKLLGPPSAQWAALTACSEDPALYDALQKTVRGPSPASRVEGWQLRALAPDVVRIEISALEAHATERVLRSMAQAVVNVHGVDAAALTAARGDAAHRPAGWLVDAVTAMSADTTAAFEDWRQSQA